MLPTLLLILSACNSYAASEEIPSALEQDPSGWIDLLAQAGPKLEGWTRVSIPPTAPLSNFNPWSIDHESGHLVVRGDQSGHEWLRYDRELSDAIFHAEWRFVPVENANNRYNSGVYIRNSTDGLTWIQAQTGDGSGGFLFGESPVDCQLQRFNLAKQVQEQRVRPAGGWNIFELRADGPIISLWVNGTITCETRDIQALSGHIGVEAEGYHIEFRNLKLKPLK